VVRYDRRGYGAWRAATASYSPANDLAALMKAVDMPHATVAGSFSGGGVAMGFPLAHPKRSVAWCWSVPRSAGLTPCSASWREQ
jgi:pimeloyl-ACP methyl ester carboxylesterase